MSLVLIPAAVRRSGTAGSRQPTENQLHGTIAVGFVQDPWQGFNHKPGLMG